MNSHVRDSLETLTWALTTFGDRVELASSFGAEDMVLIDQLACLTDRPKVFTLDTGRLHDETYRLIAETTNRYNLELKVYYPDTRQLEEMVHRDGVNLFYRSVEHRQQCCHVRKVVPLQRALSGLSAWITGLRQEQSKYREQAEKTTSETNGIVKVSPLVDWTKEQVWEYIGENSVPYNSLHDRGYPSIGCAPCTRAVANGEDERAGRWWWESESRRECGLHTVCLTADAEDRGGTAWPDRP